MVKRRRGRPKGVKNRLKPGQTPKTTTYKPKGTGRRPGRPRGAKNKPKL